MIHWLRPPARLAHFVLAALTTTLATAHAGDQIVNPNRSGAWPTVQAALDAAQPGDRILIEASGLELAPVVRKSVTIESSDATIRRVGIVCGLRIENLTPGLPLVLRRLDFFLCRAGCCTDRPGIVGSVSDGAVHMEEVVIRFGGVWERRSSVVVRLFARELWLRKCQVLLGDMPDDNGCVDILDTAGADGIEVEGQLLVIEDSLVRAGHATWLRYTNCGFGGPDNGEWPYGGPGGTALRASTMRTVLVRSSFLDGNGGSIQPGPWRVMPMPGHAEPSVFVAAGGIMSAYASTWERGRDGLVTPVPDRSRHPAQQLGYGSTMLRLDGTGRLGQTIDLVLSQPANETSIVFLSVGWYGLPTPYATLWINPATALLDFVVTGSGTTAIQVPPDPAFAELPIVAQAFAAMPMFLGNPSMIAVRR